ncbi:TPA: hypothetical protein SIA35_001019 [Aeromonas sobria]|nr:hypothetical protein [Aeromonas sobria]
MRSCCRSPQPQQTATASALACCNVVSHRDHTFNTAEQPRPEHPLPRRGAYV